MPARLDVMGGIADYSGANVCEAVLGRGMLMALQPRTDRTLRIRTVQVGRRSLPVETRIPLDYFTVRRRPRQLRASPRAVPREPAVHLGRLHRRQHFHAAERGIGQAALRLQPAAVERRADERRHRQFRRRGDRHALSCLNAYLGLKLDAARIARLGQMAENHVVGAPCGIMDQIAITSGREGKLTHILCRPGAVMGEVEIPPGTGFVGINSMVRHSVAGNPYSDVRIGAFMGKNIINEIRAKTGRAPLELSHRTFRRRNSRREYAAANSRKRFSAPNFSPNTRRTTIR